MNHKKLFAGSEIMVLAVRNLLEENNIPYIIRDDIKSAIEVGYGALGKAVHVFVEDEYLEKAEALLKENDLTE